MKRIFSVLIIAVAAVIISSCDKTPAPGQVTGSVTYRDRSVGGIEVIFEGDGGTYTYTSLSDGYFVFRDIAPGDYDVSCKFNGRYIESVLINYEKSEHPHMVTIIPGEKHVRNILIPDNEDLGWDDEEDD